MTLKTRNSSVLTLLLCIAAFPAAADTTSLLQKEGDVVIFSDKRFHCAFPSVVVRPDGEILCAFRRAPSRRVLWGEPGDKHVDPNSYLVLSRSKDGGRKWTEPELIYANPFGGSQDPCMLQLNDNSILCASYGWALLPADKARSMPGTPVVSGYGFLGGYIVRSDDGGHRWKGPFFPPPLPDSDTLNALGEPCPSYNRGAPLQEKDGSILWAVAGRDKKTTGTTSVHLMRSTDRGENWDYLSQIAADPKTPFNETSLVKTTDGALVAFIRAEGRGGRGVYVKSTDGGKTFQPRQDLSFVGYPHHALNLPDGRILLVYGYREKPYGVRARVFSGDLSDIATAPETVLRDDGGNTDLGYPWAANLPDGRILVAYYINVAGAPPHIAASVLKAD